MKTADTGAGSATRETLSGSKPVATEGDYLVREVKREPMLLFGQELEVDRNQFFAGMQLILPGVMKQIHNAGAVTTGPMIILYDALPVQSESVRAFVGIPVKSEFKKEGETEFKRIPGGVFYRMDCNADVGETMEYHLKMQKILAEKNKSFDTPVLEILTESRNDEMTVVSRAGLFYLKK